MRTKKEKGNVSRETLPFRKRSDQKLAALGRQVQVQQSVAHAVFLAGNGVGGGGGLPGDGQLQRFVTGVESGDRHLTVQRAAEHETAVFGVKVGDVAPLQRGTVLSQLAQRAVEILQFGVFPAPGEGAAVERILKALHTGLVTVENGGGAGEGEGQHGGQLQPGKTAPVLPQAQPIGGAGVLAAQGEVAVHAQKGQNAGGIVGAQDVQTGVESLGRIVLPDSLHGVAEGGGVAAGKPVQRGGAEGIVHQAVGLTAQEITAAAGIGDLVAAVLPDLTQQETVRLFLFHDAADIGDKIVGQLVGHIQTPAGGTGAQPVAHYAVLAGDDEIAVVRVIFVHCGQGVDAPPGVIAVGPVGEIEPLIVRRVLALGGTGLGIVIAT